MNKIKLELTPEEARDIIWGGNPDFKIIQEKIVDQRRWSTTKEAVVQRVSDGLFFLTGYSYGSTECQDESPYEYDEPIFEQVFPVEKTIIVYE